VTWPAVGHGAWRWAVLAALFGGLALVNIRGVKQGARTVEVMTLAKLLPLAVFVVIGGIAVFSRGGLPMPTMPELDTVGRSALVLIFAFLGAEIALISSGEIRNPARTVPASLFIALGFTAAFYLAIQFVAQGVLGEQLKDFADAPLAQAASHFLGAAGATLMLTGAVISMFGYVSGDMLGTPRSLFAFGRERLLPAVLASVHPRYHTPHVAIAVHAALVFLLAANGTFGKLVLLANVASLSLYLMGCLAAFELWRRDVRLAEAPFSFPGAGLVPLGGAAVVIWLLSHATREEFLAEAVVIALATVLYGLRALARRRGTAGG
jgi:amino acid transporter